ncbi:MAG: Bcr/CflA family efflux MFS transporter [Gammaproteobacteria bacterium]|nr:Bcr/CflA family efflux MFS transporter [Gammaproteobacteria bacterium]
MSSTAVPQEPAAQRPPIVLLAILAALGLFATNIYLPSVPAIAVGLDTSISAVQSTFTVFLLSFALAQLLMGPLADRFGRRPVALSGLTLFVAASVMCTLTDSIVVLLCGRVLQAIGACAAAVVARALVRDLWEGVAIYRVMSTLAITAAVAPGFMPLLGGLLETLGGWRTPFVVVTLIGAWMLAWSLLRIPETRQPATHGLRTTAAAAYLTLLRNPAFLLPALLAGVPSAGIFAYFAASPILFMNVLGLTPMQYGVLPTLAIGGVMAGSFTVGRLSGKVGPHTLLAIGAAVMTTGALCLLTLGLADRMGVVNVLLAVILYLYGMGILIPAGTGLSLQVVAPAQAGTAAALTGFLQMTLAALGAIIASLMPAWPQGAIGLVMTASGLMACWLWWCLPRAT